MSSQLSPAELMQAELNLLNHSEKVAWMQHRMDSKDFTREGLKLELKDPSMMPIQCKGRYGIQSGLMNSAKKWVEMALSKGWIEKIEYSEELFISPHFFKVKEGRFDEDGDPLIRPLADMSLTTAALKSVGYYAFAMADFVSFIAAIPSGTRFFIPRDLESAFNYTMLHPASRKYCAVWIMGELYWYCVCVQGLGNSANFFNAQLDHAYNAIFDLNWHVYWIKWVDDHCVTGGNYNETVLRGEILDAALDVLGYPVSDKTPNVPKEVGEIAGLSITAEGIMLNEEAVESVKLALSTVPKTLTECRTMIGSALYAHTAFKWDVNNQTFFADQMQPLHSAVAKCAVCRATGKQTEKFVWTPECEEARIALITAIEITPRYFTHSLDLISKDRCLYILGDSSDKGAGVSLHLVFMEDARDVIPSVHLQDPKMSRLLSAKSKVFGKTQVKWPTFLLEFYATYLGVKSWGNMITALTAEYPIDGPAKIGIGSDSAVNVNKWKPKELLYDIPPGEINHLCAREKKLISMAQEVAYSSYWPLVVRHVAGEKNSFCDLLSRHAEALARIRAQQGICDVAALPMVINSQAVIKQNTSLPITYQTNLYNREQAPIWIDTAVAAPTRIHSYKGIEEAKDICQGYDIISINLTDKQKQQMQAAYSTDATKYKKVKVSDIWKAVCNGGDKQMDPNTMERITAWKQRRFYNVDGLLYTPASYLRFKTGADGEEVTAEDEERAALCSSLVMVIPDSCPVRLTRSDLLRPEAPKEDAIWMEEKERGDMKLDLLLMAHDFAGHGSIGAMAKWLRKYAWFPSIITCISRHHATCVFCLQRRAAAQGIGLGTVGFSRFATLQIDYAPLPPTVSQQTGCTAILTIVDTTTGTIALLPARSQTTRETAYLLLVGWIRIYGIPRAIHADGAYGTALMKALFDLLGIGQDNLIISAPSQKGTAAKSERANQYVRKIVDLMIANGDASIEDALRMYCVIQEMMANHIQTEAGHTNFEMCFGQQPRTILDMVTNHNQTYAAAGEGATAALDTAFYEQLSARCRDLVQWDIEMQDERSREATLQKDLDYQTQRSTLFCMDVGDTVSYGSKKVELMSLSGPADAAVTAVILLDDGTEKKVRYDTLRPLGIPRPVLNFKCMRPMQTGAFVFFQLEDDADIEEIVGGTIVESTEDTITVHMHTANAANTTWLPVWTNADEDEVRSKACPTSHTPMLHDLQRDKVLAQGALTKGYFLNQNLKEALRTMGLGV
jgi:hypothetical protein